MDKFVPDEKLGDGSGIKATERVIKEADVVGMLVVMHQKGYIRLVPWERVKNLAEGPARLVEDLVRASGAGRVVLQRLGLGGEEIGGEQVDTFWAEAIDKLEGDGEKWALGTAYGQGVGKFVTDEDLAVIYGGKSAQEWGEIRQGAVRECLG